MVVTVTRGCSHGSKGARVATKPNWKSKRRPIRWPNAHTPPLASARGGHIPTHYVNQIHTRVRRIQDLVDAWMVEVDGAGARVAVCVVGALAP